MRGLIGRHAHRQSLPVPGLLLARVDSPTTPTSSIAEPTLAVVVQGAKRIAVGDHVFEYGAGDYLVVSVGLPVTGQFTEAPFLGIGLDLDPDAIAALLLESPLGIASPAPRATPALAVSTAGTPLLDALARLLRLLDEPRDIPVLAPMIRREILWRLLTGDQGELVRQIGIGESSLAQVAQAIRWIRDHHDEAFRVAKLAERVSMSPSNFHRHFRAATTMGPVQFQKKIRLQRARLLLAGNSGDVTAVAHAVGYESASQFSREYRREFGAPPTRHAQLLRSGAAGPLGTGLL